MIRTLLTALTIAAVAFVAAPRTAHADSYASITGYTCNVTTNWSATMVSSNIFSGPNCSGSFLGSISAPQAGGLATNCPAFTQPSDSALQTLAHNLVQQKIAGRPVQVFNYVLTNGTTCTYAVNYIQ